MMSVKMKTNYQSMANAETNDAPTLPVFHFRQWLQFVLEQLLVAIIITR